MSRKILITAALPYANGDIHIGHIVEYLQADIWARFQNLVGNECRYICADDTHGTPIMLNAQKQGITPEELVNRCFDQHVKDFHDFEIKFTHFDSTNTDTNREMAENIYLKMKENGHIETRDVKQNYCEHDKMFLPDRFVKGTCPKCGAKHQYGDACEVCSSTYSSDDLKDKYCVICKNEPTKKSSEHIFFKLNHFREFLQGWVKEHTQKEVANKLQEWLSDDLQDWDISRDEPYFGFKIPGTDNKYFYVWVDAPVGYISSTKRWCDENQKDYLEYWAEDSDAEIYHFIGKDIVYFHTLFWPAMLKNAGIKTPEQVFVHGFLNINGEKMSKSRGTFIMARTYLKHLDPMYLRYYYATKLSSSVEDIDLNFEDFSNRINSELVGKITNLASRGAQMLNKKIDGKMGPISKEGLDRIQAAKEKSKLIAQHYEDRNYNKALSEIRNIADETNRYFDEKEPWKMIKNDVESTREVLTTTLNLFRIMAIYLKPVLPKYVGNVEKLFNEKPYVWNSTHYHLENHQINAFEHLAKRVDMESIDNIVEEQKQMSNPK